MALCKIVPTSNGSLLVTMPDGTPIPNQVGVTITQRLDEPISVTLTLFAEIEHRQEIDQRYLTGDGHAMPTGLIEAA